VALHQLVAGPRSAPYRYVHLAAHGVADRRRALQTALILAHDQEADAAAEVLAGRDVQDGRLTAAAIAEQWRLDADLVVLSACQSALGSPGGGEGLLGFQHALFLAGARSVLLSLWKVDDAATALLMARFYENLLVGRGGPPLKKAEALAEAKRWLQALPRAEAEQLTARLPNADDLPFAHPFYWSAFILIGDPE
jgi:CHAT domain-containing protein